MLYCIYADRCTWPILVSAFWAVSEAWGCCYRYRNDPNDQNLHCFWNRLSWFVTKSSEVVLLHHEQLEWHPGEHKAHSPLIQSNQIQYQTCNSSFLTTHDCLSSISSDLRSTSNCTHPLDTSHWNAPFSARFLNYEKHLMDSYQKLMGSILGQDPSSIQVLLKSVRKIFCSPAHKPTSHQTRQNITSLLDVITIKSK